MQGAERGSRAPDTIAAVATPPGRGGIGIVRVSGPLARDIARGLTGEVPEPRHAGYRVARDVGGNPIDRGLALFFPAPASYTGEDVFEFHGHGGAAVTGAVLEACLARGGRLARPGEFTERAFLNDKLDLAQAEAVADLIDAQSTEAARLAMRSLSGEFSAQVAALGAQLTELRALTEAILDFPEEDVDALHLEDAAARLARIREGLAQLTRASRAGRPYRDGLRVVIAGRPNVGKSSLLNRLAGEERAIVTARPGTTRDVLREHLVIDGIPVLVADTAGLRDTADEIEREGIARTWREVSEADVVLEIRDATDPHAANGLDAERALAGPIPVLRVLNKIDLTNDPGARRETDAIHLSAKSGAGIDLLRAALVELAGGRTAEGSAFLARERHLRAMEDAARHLEAAATEAGRRELFAEELRLAHRDLGAITGEVTADDLLGEIFSRFCIGK